ncbi:MAG: hypothetical protein EOO50_05285 [Flavobacterium sp.]|uniref:hypothetical protein n=1 Tax=Flavobacterium sp. TaxID=239 RepID=UPI00121EA7BC|nr:hypothetical protein [Flavobacterium sp.]RZJ67697.1 MAG: hypothetical protein EOO50_05285 [Flavobacterium sp.]
MGKPSAFSFFKINTMACSSCKNKLVTPVVVIDSNFRLRDVGMFPFEFGSGEFISNLNMSDEIALRYLKENPKKISLFEKFPENWLDLISEDKPQAEVKKSNSK